MSASPGSSRIGSTAYALLFFAFLFGPLVIMVVTAFNSSSFPRVSPWECFTTDWFGVLAANDRLVEGLLNSLAIGIGVVAISVPVGLAGALALSEVGERLRGALYTILITPVLIPGVVLGISTIVFWGGLSRSLFGAEESVLFNGIFLTIVGQVTFISAYAMLIFIARLQRFDATLTEAALDLGATPGQAFRKVLLPFMKPAIGSAAFLTLLASFENYNTTVFTILADNTFTTALASKVRYGIDPSLSALAVIIIGLTLIGAIANEAATRRRERLLDPRRRASGLYANPVLRLAVHPATILALLVGMAALSIYGGSRYDSTACRAAVSDAKRAEQERLFEEQRRQMTPAPAASPSPTNPAPAPPAPANANPSPFGGAFGGGLRPGPAPAPAVPSEPAPANPSPFGGAFKGVAPQP